MKIEVHEAVPLSTLAPRSGLDFLWLELTQKCNLTCDHCYVSSGPHLPLRSRMQHQDWCTTIEKAASLGCGSLQFIGGEPLLYKRIGDLIECARSFGFEFIEIYTNGTGVSSRVAKSLSMQGVSVATSVYSDNADVHDKITGKIGSFDKTVNALRYLVENSVPVRASFIEMTSNRGHFSRTHKMLELIGISKIGCDEVRDFGRGSGEVGKERFDLFAETSFAGLCGQCAQGRLCITYDGTAYPCIMSRSHPVGNVIDQGLEGVLAARDIKTFREEMSQVTKNRIETGCAPMEIVACKPEPTPCMVCGPSPDGCRPDWNPCVPDVPGCQPPHVRR